MKVFLSRDVLVERRTLGAVQGLFPVVTSAGVASVDVTAVPHPTVARHFAGAPAARAAHPRSRSSTPSCPPWPDGGEGR